MRRLSLLLAILALALPAAASAATPRFGLWDLQSDLAGASRNVYGDVQVKSEHQLAGKGTLVRCGTWCRFGSGWLAFRRRPHLGTADVSAARMGYSKRQGWYVAITLRPSFAAAWTRFRKNVAEGAKLRGVPDVLIVAAGGQVTAVPFSSQVSTSGDVVTIAGFSRASAKATVSALG